MLRADDCRSAMFVPTCAAAISALILLGGCGGAAETPARPLEQPSAQQLHGEWRRAYVTAGPISSNARLRFTSEGAFTLDTTSMNSLSAPPILSHYQGSYHGTERGTVQYSWETEGGQVQAEHSLTFLEGRALAHRCCTPRDATDRWWSHRGYLATSLSQTTFHREAAQRILETDGTLRSSLEARVDLTFSNAPARLVGRDDGTLEVAVQIDVSEPEGRESRSFRRALPCRVQADGGGVLVISLPGWDSADGVPLLERPYHAPALWAELLAREADTREWSETARAALQDAFEPYLAFDDAEPNVLFHHIDWNSVEVTGYARVAN